MNVNKIKAICSQSQYFPAKYTLCNQLARACVYEVLKYCVKSDLHIYPSRGSSSIFSMFP